MLPIPKMLRVRRPSPAFLPAGLRVYAIGDIHGSYGLLDEAEQCIAREERQCSSPGESIVIFLGDYIDRGPASREVIERLQARTFAGLPARFILGNHEDALQRFIADPVGGAAWLEWGGIETLASYGLDGSLATRPTTLRTLAAALSERMPISHHLFLADLELSIEFGGFLFVHAGIRPGVTLDQQERQDLLGIRSPFLRSRATFTHRVVHGHTITQEVEVLPQRIGLDTGAYRSGRLAIVKIEGSGVAVLE